MQFDVMAFTRCRHKTALLAEVKGYNSQDTMEKMNFFSMLIVGHMRKEIMLLRFDVMLTFHLNDMSHSVSCIICILQVCF